MKLATLCYLKKDGKTLMLFRNKKKNDIHARKWNGLGGKFNPGETPEECVLREVYEESGLKIENPRLCGFLTFPQFSAGEDWYVFVFTATDFSGDLSDSPEGKLAWIADDELLNLDLWAGDQYFLPLLDSGSYFSGKFVYRDGKLFDFKLTK